MMRRILLTSLRNRGVVLIAGAVLLVLGVMQFRSMPRDVLPEFTRPTVEVQTEALGLAAAEVEQLVTVPLEQDLLNGVAFLDTIRSQSVPGLSSIQLVFKRGTDLARARQVVNERLTQAAALPHVSAPPQMLQPLASESRLMMIRLSSTSSNLTDLGVLARWTIRPRLMGVSGVADVAIWGQRERQIQVQVDPKKLQNQSVSLEQVISTTGNALWWSPLGRLEANTPGTGGFIDGPQQRLGILHESPIKTPEDLSKVTLESAGEGGVASGTTPLTLGDVSNLVADHQPLIGDAVFAEGNGLLMVVEKLPEANVVDVTKSVDEALDAMRPGLSGVTVDATVFRPANYVNDSLGNVVRALLLGGVLLVVVVSLLALDWRTAFITAVSTLLSLAAAVLVLGLRGVSLNSMVVAGLVLAIAVLVDEAMLVTENVRRRLREHHPELASSSEAVAVHGTVETRGPVVYATLALLLALLPITALHGEAGAFVPSIAFAFVIAVLVSLLVAVTVTPLLSLVVFRGRDRTPRISPLMARVLALHGKVGSRLLTSPRSSFGTLAALLLVGLVALPFVKRGDSLVPAFKDRSVLVHWEAAPGTSLTEMSRITARASQEIGALPGIGGVGAHVGRAVGGDQVVGTGSGEMWVTMKSSAAYAKTLQSIRSVVSGYPGMVHTVLTYPTERIQQMLNSTGRDLTVRIFGDDFTVLNSKAAEVAKVLGAVKGVRDPKIHSAPVEPALEVKVNLDAADKVGIKPGDVRRAATTLVSGLTVGALFEEQKVFDVVVVGEPATRASLTAIKDLTIESPTGKHVRLGDVADVAIAPGLSAIRHEDVSRYIDVDANVSGRTTESAAADAKDALKRISFPLQHRAVLLGEYAQRANESREFLVLSVAAALGILLLLQSAFRSWRLAAIVFVTLPTALAGGVIGALVAAPFSLGSMVGFLALFALAARSTMMLIGRYRELELHESTTERADLVLKGTHDSIAPVLLTAAGIALVLLPFLVFSDAAGFEIAHRLAVVVVCGLVSTTLFALVIVPALYLRFGRPTEPDVWELLEPPERVPVAAPAGHVSGNGDGVQTVTTAGRDNQ
jgi:Cu/Ag efflux pump CusA